MSDEENPLLEKAIKALRANDTAKAREILTAMLKAEPNNPEYWLWMSAAVESEKERRYCLQKALAADPEYAPARQGLILLGELPAEEVEPASIPKPFAWKSRFSPQEGANTDTKSPRASPRTLIGIAILALLMLLSWAGWHTWQKIRPLHLATPQLLINTTQTPTLPPTPSPTPVNPLALSHPTPLEQLLRATYTPTTLAIKTPHKIEAFRLGLHAMQAKRWEDALNYFQQTLQTEGHSKADVYFFIGEIYRQQGKWIEAEKAYNAALEANPQMAAALVGLAQVYMHNGEDQKALQALNQAEELQPQYGLTYLIRAKWYLQHHEAKKALDDLAQAADLLPNSPLVALYRAKAYLALGKPEQALAQAKLAHKLDITLLEAYKVIGESAVKANAPEEAIRYLRTYLSYAPHDAEGYVWLAKAYHAIGKEREAAQAAKKALENSHTLTNYRLLAEFYLAAGKTDEAVKVLQTAAKVAPNDFQTKIALAKALLANNEAAEAFQVLHKLEPSLKTKEQRYTFYYWRAKTLTALSGQGPRVKEAAIRDWRRILEAPQGLVPEEWRKEAQRQINLLLTPQPSPTP